MSSNHADAEVFVYMGEARDAVPQNVVRVRVDPSVTSISAHAFFERNKLTEVELSEGVVEIGEYSFAWCDHSITKISIPASLRGIHNQAFKFSLRTPIRLHDGIESIGEGAFAWCIFTNIRIPPLITVIPKSMLYWCKSIFSLEISEDVSVIESYAFCNCICLRNVAFQPNAIFENLIFDEDDEERETIIITDLLELFGSDAEIIRVLQHRFDELPIHSIVYYQSYHEGALQRLIAAINMRSGLCGRLRSQVNPSGNHQDCLGMTPLHILACSSVHNLELYRVIVDKYPANLITEDRWGALPLLYALWGAAPTEIIHFLLESYRSLYPDHEFNWTLMVETMGRTDTPKEVLQICYV